MPKSTQLDYTALAQEVGALVDEFGGMRANIVKHLAPQPELKFYRTALTDWLKEIHQDLEDVRTRVSECGEAFAALVEVEPEETAAPVSTAEEMAAVEAAVAEAIAPAPEAKPQAPKAEAKPEPKKRAPVPA